MATAPLAGVDAPQSALPVTIDDIRAAGRAIEGAVLRTPCLHSRTLSEITGAQVWLKFENLQFTAAYKERGALNKLLTLSAQERGQGVVAASAGNHAQAVAYHARRLGIPATIVMPQFTPIMKVTQTEHHGATVILHGETFDEAFAHALDLGERNGQVLVHAFDDAAVIAGQGTVALEMLEQTPEIDTLVIPIGGGGLISGMSIAARAVKPGIAIVGAEAELYPAMHARLNGYEPQCGGDTLAEGIAVKEPGRLTTRIARALVDDILLVSERYIEGAVALLLNIEKTVVEGAGAAGLAALQANSSRFRGRNVGLVLCGGNIDTRLLATVLQRELAREGRLARLRIAAKDRPGAIYTMTKLFHEHQVNIVEIHHQRVFTKLPAKGTVIEFEIETRDRAHLDRLIAGLRKAGYVVDLIETA